MGIFSTRTGRLGQSSGVNDARRRMPGPFGLGPSVLGSWSPWFDQRDRDCLAGPDRRRGTRSSTPGSTQVMRRTQLRLVRLALGRIRPNRVLAQRNPLLLFRFDGSLSLRFEAAKLEALSLFQLPPRMASLVTPDRLSPAPPPYSLGLALSRPQAFGRPRRILSRKNRAAARKHPRAAGRLVREFVRA